MTALHMVVGYPHYLWNNLWRLTKCTHSSILYVQQNTCQSVNELPKAVRKTQRLLQSALWPLTTLAYNFVFNLSHLNKKF